MIILKIILFVIANFFLMAQMMQNLILATENINVMPVLKIVKGYKLNDYHMKSGAYLLAILIVNAIAIFC